MTTLKCNGRYLRDFGHGTTDDPDKAHDFTPEEAMLLVTLNPRDYTVVGDGYGETTLDNRQPPHWSPGHDMVWVQYNGCWMAAERQALFMGTRNALRSRLTATDVA